MGFRPLAEDDFDLLARWLASDHVQQWWRDSEAPAEVAEKHGPRVRGEVPTEVFVVCVDGTQLGMIQIASCRVLEKSGYERRWQGVLASDDPWDADEAALYVRTRSDWVRQTNT